MKRLALIALLVACAAVAGPRSAAEKLAFQREHPCPSTGLRRGSCPGYVIDHPKSICSGGEDKRTNMAWQEYRESLIKDAEERRECRALRRARQG